MQLSQVMDRLADALGNVPGLRVFPYSASRVVPPAALVGWPEEYEFDSTMGRGSDRCRIPVLLLVGRVDERTARDALAKYADGSGPSSVKQAIEQFTPATPVWDSVRVRNVEFDVATVASVDYLAATFNIEIVGKGS